MQPSDNLSFAVSKISKGLLFAACSSEKKSAPSKPHVPIKNGVYGVPLLSPWSHRFPCQTEPFSAKFPNGIGGRHGSFFFGHESSPSPTRESALCPGKMRSN